MLARHISKLDYKHILKLVSLTKSLPSWFLDMVTRNPRIRMIKMETGEFVIGDAVKTSLFGKWVYIENPCSVVYKKDKHGQSYLKILKWPFGYNTNQPIRLNSNKILLDSAVDEQIEKVYFRNVSNVKVNDLIGANMVVPAAEIPDEQLEETSAEDTDERTELEQATAEQVMFGGNKDRYH